MKIVLLASFVFFQPVGSFRFTAIAAVFLAGAIGNAAPPKVPSGKMFQAEVKLLTPRNESKRSAAGSAEIQTAFLFVPDSVDEIKGVICNPFYNEMAGKPYWQTLCAHWDFAVIGTNYFGVKKDEMGTTTLALLEALSVKSGHSELANANLVFVGMSAGGGISAQIAGQIPERTIAVAPVCLEVGPCDEGSFNIPMLTVFGERDGKQLEILSEKLPAAREGNAKWAIAIQWGQRHDWHRASNVIIPFLDAVIRSEENPYAGDWKNWGEAPAKVASLAESGGDATSACWFPDANTAAAWQALVVRNHKLKINYPPGIGGGQDFILHPAGEPVEVRVSLKDKSITDLALFNGAAQIATASDGELVLKTPPLTAGPHTLIVRGTDSGGIVRLSEPHVILVVK